MSGRVNSGGIAVTAALALSVVFAAAGAAEEPAGQPASAPCAPLSERQTLTDNWFGLGEPLAERGITVNLSATQIYQINLQGGMSTHRRAGRYSGSYDLELGLDLEKLLKLPGGQVYLLAEGSWSEGLDASSVGSLFGVNADAAGDRAVDVTELWYEQALLGEKLRLRLGKLDLTGGFECRGCPVTFDGNAFANDETSQFLNAALVNNPAIPFPAQGLGAIAYLQPAEWWYVSAGAADAQADAREIGLNTAFHGEDHFFAIFEAGVVPRIASANGPLQGAYRFGLWYDPQPKDRFGGGTKRDDAGIYLSVGQTVLKESDRAEDGQGLSLFARYGWADGDVNPIRCFWSAGAQYQGLIPARDDDVLGLGVAQGRLAGGAGLPAEHETAMEIYYNAFIAPWLQVGPSLQYVFNPGGRDGDDAVVLGLRLQMAF